MPLFRHTKIQHTHCANAWRWNVAAQVAGNLKIVTYTFRHSPPPNWWTASIKRELQKERTTETRKSSSSVLKCVMVLCLWYRHTYERSSFFSSSFSVHLWPAFWELCYCFTVNVNIVFEIFKMWTDFFSFLFKHVFIRVLFTLDILHHG